MKMKTIIVLAFAVGCGLIAMMGVQQMISQQAGNEDVPVKVLVATADIPPGVLLNENSSAFEDYPSSAVPADAVRNKEDYLGCGLKVPVDKGDIIRMVKLGTRGEIAASASIPKGMRTFSFKVDDTKTHSGLLQPGDRVDLILTFEYRSNQGDIVTRTDTLLEYIEVFASDEFRNLEVGESREIKAKNLTLLVTPDQANILQLANTKGELSPIMRNKEDKELAHAGAVDESLLMLLASGKVQEIEEEEVLEQPELPPVETPVVVIEQAPEVAISEPIKQEPIIQPPTWTLTIYSGKDVISHDFLLEQSQSSSEDQEAKLPEDNSVTVPLGALQEVMNSFLKPGKQKVDSEPQPENLNIQSLEVEETAI